MLGAAKGRRWASRAVALGIRASAFIAAVYSVYTLLQPLPLPISHVVAAAAGATAFTGWLWVYLLILSLSYTVAAVASPPPPIAAVALSVLLAYLAHAKPDKPALLGGAVLLAAAYMVAEALTSLAHSLPELASQAGAPGIALAPFFATPVGRVVVVFASAVVLFVLAGWVSDIVAGMLAFLRGASSTVSAAARGQARTMLAQDKRTVEFFADAGLWFVASVLFAPTFTIVVDVVVQLSPYRPSVMAGAVLSYLAPLSLSLAVWWLVSRALRTADVKDLAYIALIGLAGLAALLALVEPGSLAPTAAAALGIPGVVADDPLTPLLDEESYLAYIETSMEALDEMIALLIKLLWPS